MLAHNHSGMAAPSAMALHCRDGSRGAALARLSLDVGTSIPQSRDSAGAWQALPIAGSC
jgi:hypothetical protein